MKTNRKRLFIVAALFQLFILGGMLISSNIPLWFGKEIKVNVEPVDPRSLLRGNYVRLRYDFESIAMKTNKKRDTKVYVELKENNNSMYEFEKVSFEKPTKGIFLQGRVKGQYFKTLEIKVANINAYFTQKKNALKLEKELRRGSVIAVLMVDSRGKAIIKNVYGKREEKE